LVILRRSPSIVTKTCSIQRIGQQRVQLLFSAAAGVAGLPLLETGVQRRARPGPTL
jgi:hypothetical protein